MIPLSPPVKGAGLPPAAGSGGIPAALVLSPVDMWKSALTGRTRLKGVDKPVDGQRAARPPVCPPPAAFPHTHRRNRKFKKKTQEQEPKSDESNIVLDSFLAVPYRLNIHIRTASKKIFPDRRLRLTLLPYLVLFLPYMVTIRVVPHE